MNLSTYSLEDTKLISVRFELILPLDDWLWLFEFAEKADQSTPAYIMNLLREHVQRTRPLFQEETDEH